MSTGHFQHKETGAGANLLALPAGVELGQYRIIRKLGQGGFGITYLAEHIGNGELVVIKENLPTFCAMRHSATLQVTATDPDDELQEYAQYLRRFVDEAKLLAKLDHPHIVKVREAFEALGTAYYVMPWVGGKELQKAAPARDKIDEAWLLPILRTMLGTLEYLHGRNIYHRDVKPSNILLTEEGSPVLIDFGTARAIISDRSATHVGSPGYSPIEQLRAKGKRGPWTDVYSLGATCYRLITGERPPEAFDRADEDEDPLRPLAPRTGLHARFSPAFLAGIDKALSQRGKDRWKTATEWLAALPVPITHPVIDEPISRSISTTPITTEQEEKVIVDDQAKLRRLLSESPFGANQALYWAALYGRTECVRLLLAAPGIDVNTADKYGWTPLHKAADGGHTECVRLLLAAPGIDVNTAGRRLETPLHKAADGGHTECVRLLLAAPGIDVNTANKYSETPLRDAAYWGHTECVRLLLAAPGIDVNKADSRGSTPLNNAADEGHTECVRLLLAAPGIDVNKADSDGWTPLYEAADGGHTECVRLLLAAPGIDVNKVDEYGVTPLNGAADGGHTECVRLLLAAPGIDVNKADSDGETPLYEAAREGHSECVKLLLAAPGIDVNKADSGGETPLYVAAKYGNDECVRLLLAAPGIDVNKADKYGKTPLYVAAKYGNDECASLIKAAGGK